MNTESIALARELVTEIREVRAELALIIERIEKAADAREVTS
jgi:hypothetical protein